MWFGHAGRLMFRPFKLMMVFGVWHHVKVASLKRRPTLHPNQAMRSTKLRLEPQSPRCQDIPPGLIDKDPMQPAGAAT